MSLCGRAGPHANECSRLQPSGPRCVSELLWPMFGEFLSLVVREQHELLPHSGADQPVVNSAGEKGFKKSRHVCESRHSNELDELQEIKFYYQMIILLSGIKIRTIDMLID